MTYPPGFERCWQAYPKNPPGRSKKRLAGQVWGKLHLEPQADAVLDWIKQLEDCREWREGYAPGFQVWIKQVDFGEAPPRSVGPDKTHAGGDGDVPPLLRLQRAAIRAGRDKGIASPAEISMAAYRLWEADKAATVADVLAAVRG